MARFGCICGNTLSNTNCPSDCIIHIFTKEDAMRALNHDENITLLDFLSGWDEKDNCQRRFISGNMEYWYCPECKRIYQVEAVSCGKATARYLYSDINLDSDIDNLRQSDNRLFVLSDVSLDNLTEKNNITLKWFIEEYAPEFDFYSNKTLSKIIATFHKTEQIAFVYNKN